MNDHMPQSLETAPAPLSMQQRKPRLGLSLFWRTFFLLAVLLFGSTGAWLQTFRTLEYGPRAVMAAQQIVALVNLSQVALEHTHSDTATTQFLMAGLKSKEDIEIIARKPNDQFHAFEDSSLDEHIMQEVHARLGKDTRLAISVNGVQGLWISLMIGKDPYWLKTKLSRINPDNNRTWVIWLIIAAALSLAGAAVIAQLINRPLKELSFAASRVRDGDFDASHLDERATTSEIREVNIGFNRMAEQLAKIEQDRAVMLAGISHDLRTPLARLRLETEMSVADETARDHMASDIDQLDAIIDKFLDYARPGQTALVPVKLLDVVEACAYPFQEADDIRVNIDIHESIEVMADHVDLARIISNLLENARRYGKSVETGVAVVDVLARVRDDWVVIKVRDHGMGVAQEALSKLTKPFFRGDAARTAATGAGLGLSIVDKTVQRMGGIFGLANSSTGGLSAHIRLHEAK